MITMSGSVSANGLKLSPDKTISWTFILIIADLLNWFNLLYWKFYYFTFYALFCYRSRLRDDFETANKYTHSETQQSLLHTCPSFSFHQRNVLWQGYFVYFHSVSVIFWGNSTDSLKVLKDEKKRPVRFVFWNTSRQTCKELFNEFKILPLSSTFVFCSI